MNKQNICQKHNTRKMVYGKTTRWSQDGGIVLLCPICQHLNTSKRETQNYIKERLKEIKSLRQQIMMYQEDIQMRRLHMKKNKNLSQEIIDLMIKNELQSRKEFNCSIYEQGDNKKEVQ